MRILFCVSDTPLPPFVTGYRQQLRGLVAELSKTHEVRLVGYKMPEQNGDPEIEASLDMVTVPYRRAGLMENAHDLALALATGRPLRAERYCEGLRRVLREEVARFQPDVVHVGPGKLSGLLSDLDGLPTVLNLMDAWFLNVEARATGNTGLRRWLYRTDAERVRKFMRTHYRGWDRVVASNQEDLDTMRALDPSLPFVLIPIGFDAGAFSPDPTAEVDCNRVFFHGTLDYAPNVLCAEHLARDVMPLVRAQHAEAELVLCGRSPADSVWALHDLSGVTVLGPVDDMRAELVKSRLWCGPFQHGTGIKTKVLEAMATDLPAVVTPVGGRGLDLHSGALLVGDTAQEVADHIVSLLRDDALTASLGAAGGEYVRRCYDWPAVGRAYEEVYAQVIEHQTLVRA